MRTWSGRDVWPTWTDVVNVPTDIGPSLEDIAVHLGRTCRWRGGCDEFYTVLCHMLVCGQLAREFWPDKPMMRRHLLLHDGHEAIGSDTPTTWKNLQTREDEAEIDRRIALEHGLDPLSAGDHLMLKHVDEAALVAEAHALRHSSAEEWWPRDNFDDLADRAFDLTVLQVQVGNPIAFLHPENAIRALTRALER